MKSYRQFATASTISQNFRAQSTKMTDWIPKSEAGKNITLSESGVTKALNSYAGGSGKVQCFSIVNHKNFIVNIVLTISTT